MGFNVAKTIFQFIKNQVHFNKMLVYKFLNLILVCFYHFFNKYNTKNIFFLGPFASDFAGAKSKIAKIMQYLFKLNQNPAMFVFPKAYTKRTPPKIGCVGF